MHLKLIAVAGAAAVMLMAPARADASCCDNNQKDMACCAQKDMPCCAEHKDMKDMKDMPCCADHKDMKDMKPMACCDKDAVEMLLSLNPQINPAPPVRQQTDIWFKQPVKFGNKILQGHYVIEHDNDRMAKGDPCTHIYAFDDRTRPVVTFHCTHLERPRVSQNTAVIVTKGDHKVMTEFQFAGETAAHGNPLR